MSAKEYPNAWAVQYNIGVHDGVGMAKDKLNEMKDIINEMFDAIQRVRELANHWLNGESKDIPYDSDQFAKALLKALDGEE